MTQATIAGVCPKCGALSYYSGDMKAIVCSKYGSAGCDYYKELEKH